MCNGLPPPRRVATYLVASYGAQVHRMFACPHEWVGACRDGIRCEHTA